MTSLHQIKDSLWAELGELYEAAYAAQERLEEGEISNLVRARHDPAGHREAEGLSDSKPRGS